LSSALASLSHSPPRVVTGNALHKFALYSSVRLALKVGIEWYRAAEPGRLRRLMRETVANPTGPERYFYDLLTNPPVPFKRSRQPGSRNRYDHRALAVV
jgi:hypothetical protein